jgi:hypothetical protein
MVFMPITPSLAIEAQDQVRQALGKATRLLAYRQACGADVARQKFRPVIDGIRIGLKVLLLFIGMPTLGFRGIGVLNIMLVS